jgi:hypothetical protein
MTNMEQNAVSLLDGVTGIIKDFEERWQKTGEKYNLFKVADIAHKEVIMCRVLADLMNPQGKHCQGSRYLRLFWETVAPKLPEKLSLDIEHTKVTAEYVIDENRRIDIALEDGKVFVPIEAKILAGDQPRQVADYFAFAQTESSGVHVPVLYLTVDGHEPQDFSKAGVGKNDYVLLSFKQDILAWLEACVRENATEAVVPVRENLKQLIAAIKSLCGKSEDAEMEDAIFKLVIENDDTMRAALAIRAMDFDNRARNEFKETVLPLVNKDCPNAGWCEDDGWYYISIPINGGKYYLEANYDWKSFHIVPADNTERDSRIEEQMAKEMASYTNHKNGYDGGGVFALWGTNRYPGLEAVDEALYFSRLSKIYFERPQEVADRIISMARSLENVKA